MLVGRLTVYIVLIASTVSAIAGTKTFVGQGAPNTNWEQAKNWTPAGEPTSSDTAIIPNLAALGVPYVKVTSPTGTAGTVIIQSGGDLRFGDYGKSLRVTGDFIIQPGGQCSFYQNRSTSLYVAGNFVNNGSFVATGYVVIFNGTGTQTISGTSPTQFFDLRVTNPNGVTINGTQVNVAGTLAPADLMPILLNGGTFTVGGAPLPITLAWFQAIPDLGGRGVTITWKTITEVDNFGFFIERRSESASSFDTLSFVPTQGNGIVPHLYSFTDNAVQPGSWIYRLRQADLSGSSEVFDEVRVEVNGSASTSGQALSIGLQQNYPNPFNPQTTISFSVDQSLSTTMKVYNIIGEEVATLFDNVAESGRVYTVNFNGSNLPSGAYFCRLETGSRVELRRMLLVR